jgi:hypothetical protein
MCGAETLFTTEPVRGGRLKMLTGIVGEFQPNMLDIGTAGGESENARGNKRFGASYPN